ncbi:MAG: hypothetical protein HRT99_03180 [Mycoplasmatales bacterium]|nr:hypothetical protein [Mycoplasmatales bacterium]
MKKNDGWLNALFSLVFIATPALIIFYFFLPSWSGFERVSYGTIWGIAIGFIFYVILLSVILIRFEILSIESLNFNIPISIVLVIILVSYPLALWATAIFVIIGILLAFPVNMLVNKYKESKIKQKK